MTSLLNWLSDSVNSVPVAILLRLSLILAAAWFVHLVFRNGNPRYRIAIWRLTAIGIVFVTVASATSLRFDVPLLPAQQTSSAVEISATTAERVKTTPPINPERRAQGPNRPMPDRQASAGQERGFSNTRPIVPVPELRRESKPTLQSSSPPQSASQRTKVPAASSPAEVTKSSWNIIQYSVALWVVGSLALIAKWGIGLFQLLRMYRGAKSVSDEVEAQAKRAAESIGYQGTFELRHTDKIASPAIVGLWRPRILLPTDQCERPDEPELRAMLAHELAHCQGYDLRWNHALTLLAAALWFHPLAWRMRLAHVDACDERCDETAAAYLGNSELYGRLLAALALRVHACRAASALAMARRSRVRQRIERIQQGTSGGISRWRLGFVIAAVVMMIIATGTLGISRSQAEPPADSGAASEKPSESPAETKESSSEPEEKPAKKRLQLPIRIIDAESGDPLGDVKVSVRGRIDDERFTSDLRSSDQGEVRVRGPEYENMQSFSFKASKPGYVPVYYYWDDDNKPIELPERLELQLTPGQTIEGQVVDESGNPVVGVKITFTMRATHSTTSSLVFTAGKTETDEDGHWSWDAAPAEVGSVGIRAEHPDYLRGGISASRGSGNKIVLSSGLRVEGFVRDTNGEPIRGAVVRLGTGSPSSWKMTDGEGHFRFDKCEPGPSALLVQVGDFSPATQVINVNSSLESVEFTLDPAHVLRGQVVDVNGNPLEDVLVAPEEWQGVRTIEQRMRTDAEGRFVWDSAPPDAVEFSILKQGYMSQRDYIITAGLLDDSEEHVIILHPELRFSGKVTDASTGKPIEEFAIRYGYQFSNRERIYWSDDAPVPYSGGEYLYLESEPKSAHYLQVVAAGYEPQTSRALSSTEGNVQLDFELQSGEGPSGIVVTSEGKPVADAEVGLGTPERRIFFRNGQFDRNQNQALMTRSDEAGKFRFNPLRDEYFLIVILHEEGFAEVSKEELAKNEEIVLQSWGKVRGKLFDGDKAIGGEEVSYWPQLPRNPLRQECVWGYRYKTKTDEDGTFEFDRAIPGPGSASRLVVTRYIRTWSEAPAWQTPVEVDSNETSEVIIGGTGRPLIGKVVLDRVPDVAIDWTMNSPVSVYPKPGQNSVPIVYTRFIANIDKSGEFRIPDVPAGDYFIRLAVNNPPSPNACGAGDEIGKAEFEFSVPSMPGGRSDEPLDLGTITATLFDTLDVGEAAPDFASENLRGGTLRLSDYEGKLVLLDFWATWCGPCLAEMPTLKRIYERFADDPRFALISLSCDNSIDAPRAYVNENQLAWHQAHVSGTSARAPKDYALRTIPATFLIAPNGRVLAKNLRGEELVDTVAAALEDEGLFSHAAGAYEPRFPVVRFKAEASKEDAPIPAVVVLDNIDPTYEKDVPGKDSLRALDREGNELWKYVGLHSSQSVGGVHGVAVDTERCRIYVRENVVDRIVAFDFAGQKLWQVEQIPVGTIAVDPKTGYVWASGGPSLKSGETVVFDDSGNEAATYPFRGIDMEYDPKSDAFWLVGYDTIKLSRDGKVLFREPVNGWCCASVSVDPNNGNVWIAERAHSDVLESRNRLWLRDSNGKVIQRIDLNEDHISVVECDPSTGGALFSGYNIGLRLASVAGEVEELGIVGVTNLAVGTQSGDSWISTNESLLRIDPSGNVLQSSEFSAESKGAWIVAF